MATNPWEMNWSAVTPITANQPTVEQKNPWEQNWGGIPSREEALSARRQMRAARASNMTSQGEDPTFDSVFENLIQAESRGKHFTNGELTTSPVGAQGITQVMPKTGRDPGYGITPLQNNSEKEFVRFGRDYLKAMLGVFDGDFEKAVAAYNAGPGNVQKAVTAAKKNGGSWVEYLPKKSETIPYMNKILATNY